MASLMPTPTEADLVAGLAFDAMMRALSRPGELVEAGISMPDLAVSLLDLEVSHFAASQALAAQLAGTGSPRVPIGEADYLFYPELADEHLHGLADLKCGDPLYPDTAATLVVGSAAWEAGALLRLTGPGIAGEREVMVSRIPSGLWSLRKGALAFPLGWDLFVFGQGKLMGLPRSTRIEVL